ncbi:MAG: LysR substrate-binding domain-containing protein [Acidimicrobiales bacterium]
MELRQAQYVVAAVDNGGFGRAADALGVSQPSVSQAIAALERELGVALFHRLGRGVTLTSAGHAFLEPARQLLRDAATARQTVRQVAENVSGQLDLVALPTLAVDPLAPLVGRFRRSHPDVTIRMAEPDDAAAVIAMVRDGRSELGLAQLPVPADLAATGLGHQELFAVSPPGTHRRRNRLAVSDFADLPLVATPRGTATRDLIDHAFAGAALKPTIAVETDQREAILPLVLAGAGTCVLPGPLADRARDQGAVVAGFDPPLRRQIGMVRRRGPLSPAATAFVALATATIAARGQAPPAGRKP